MSSPFTHARRSLAMGTVATLLFSGLVTIPAIAAAAADPTPGDRLLVSRADSGTSSHPSLSSDGQHVALVSSEALIAGDTNGVSDIYFSTAIPGSDDPFSGQAMLVSRPGGSAAVANGASSEPAISADGRYVVFTSAATNLVTPATTAGTTHVYVRDTVLGTTTLVAPTGVEPNGDSYGPDISEDGRMITLITKASNIIADDTDGVADVVVVERDADGDGAFTTMTFGSPTVSNALAADRTKLSGDGRYVFYQSVPSPDRRGSEILRATTSDFSSTGGFFIRFAGPFDVDARGNSIAYISYGGCIDINGAHSGDTVVVSTMESGQERGIAILGTAIDSRAGEILDVAMSSDASTVAWSSTMPAQAIGTTPVALTEPVVRVDRPDYETAPEIGNDCAPGQPVSSRLELGEGSDVSLSAGGRTVTLTGPSDDAPTAAASVVAVDTHSNNGLSVTRMKTRVSAAAYLASIDVARVPAASIHDFGDAFAGAPIHRLPIHRLPIHRLPIHRLPIADLPIHRLPIHRLPIHRLDLPAGWASVLADTPFADQSELVVTLADVLEWADGIDANGGTAAEQAAADRIHSLTLDDLDLTGSGIDALSLGAMVLGAVPVADVPIPGDGSNLQRWQAVVDAQGVTLTVTPTTVLADLDWAGIDVGRTGIDGIALNSLARADTLLDTMPANSLLLTGTTLGALPVAELTDLAALFDGPVTGVLADNIGAMKPTATAKDLAGAVPDRITFGDVLTALLDRSSYPWEQISPTSFDAVNAQTISGWPCVDQTCAHEVRVRFAFDAGPGEPAVFPAVVADLVTPVGTDTQTISMGTTGPTGVRLETPLDAAAYGAYRERARVPLGDVRSGTVVTAVANYSITSLPGAGQVGATLTSGDLTAAATMSYALLDGEYDIAERNYSDGAWGGTNGNPPEAMAEGMVYYEWLSSGSDTDFYRVPAPPAGKRLVVSTNATDGQVSLGLYKPADATTDLGIASAGPAPGTGTAEQDAGTNGAPSTAGADAGDPVTGSVLVDQAVVAGDGAAEVQAAAFDQPGGGDMLVRVTSGNGLPSSSLYSLRVQYMDEPPEPVCAPWAPAQTTDPGVVGTSDAVTDATNTVYLMDTKRLGDTWGSARAADIRTALLGLDGKGAADAGKVSGAVLSVDASDAVRAARDALDANPCSMTARAALTRQINAYVSAQLGAHRSQITSVVIVGGDDIMPMAPIAEHTQQFTEAGHAADLRLTKTLSGDLCPSQVAQGAVDPCATPLSSAAATSHILSDDPYALATAYDTLGGTLYVPSAGIGRLIESPDEIIGAIDRFAASDGVLAADSTTTGGYGAWSELPDLVTQQLAWRSIANDTLTTPWDREAVMDAVFPAAGESARVVSLNAHYDETRMLPGITGAEDGVYKDSDLLKAADVTDADATAGALIFTIGCHAANNLPTAYYGDREDWVDVFQNAGAFVGNTGYGLANDTTTALGERLLALYSSWIGVTSDKGPVTAAGALVQAKRAYLAGLGLYSGYDEKVLQEAVYYGLPMYTFANSTHTAPLPAVPSDLTAAREVEGGLLAASFSLHPALETVTKDGSSYLTSDEAPAVIAGEPVLPRVTRQLGSAVSGTVARGALIRGLTSSFSDTVTPLVAGTTAGVDSVDDAMRDDMAFPSTFAHVTHQQTPDGTVDQVVVTPARVQARVGGTGVFERFDDMDIDVVYGEAASTDDLEPAVTSTSVEKNGASTRVSATADGTGSPIATMLLLAQAQGSAQWQAVTLTPGADDVWSGTVPIDGPFRWFLQVVDQAGNVAIDTARGHLDVANAPAPRLPSAGPDATLRVGDRLLRDVAVEGVGVDDRLTGSYTLTTPDGVVAASGVATVGPDDTGATRARIDAVVTTPGAYTATITVCRSGACSDATFALTVKPDNQAPGATATLTSNTAEVRKASVLTAHAEGTDPDGDAVTLAYRWLRNGQPIDGETGAVLDLAGIAQPGDVITVEVTPSDGQLTGGAARAWVTVLADPLPPAGPTITATAKANGVAYTPGAWSRYPVTVTFTCAGALQIVSCPAATTLSADTPAAGVEVSGTVKDVAQRTATTSLLVRIDRTAPKLAPTVSPNPVVRNSPATATAHATDAGSGVASQSCATPSTAALGSHTVTCTAKDAAGNTASATARYLVLPRTPAKCAGGPDRMALAPLNADGTSVFLRTSAVPVAFHACGENGAPISTKGFVTKVEQVSSAALTKTAKVNELWYPQVTTTFSYILLARTWIGTIPTKNLATGMRYTYRVTLADGTSFTVTFGVR